MGNLLVPIQAIKVIGPSSPVAELERVLCVVEIPDKELSGCVSNLLCKGMVGNVYLSLRASGSEKLRFERVELKGLDSPTMLGCSRD